MSDIAGELARVREVFDKPTLRLLDRKWAPPPIRLHDLRHGAASQWRRRQ